MSLFSARFRYFFSRISPLLPPTLLLVLLLFFFLLLIYLFLLLIFFFTFLFSSFSFFFSFSFSFFSFICTSPHSSSTYSFPFFRPLPVFSSLPLYPHISLPFPPSLLSLLPSLFNRFFLFFFVFFCCFNIRLCQQVLLAVVLVIKNCSCCY